MPGTLPAVSGLNGKIAAFGGGAEDIGVGGVLGSVSFPLETGFGAQLDGMIGGGDALFYGGGAHLFWRNPSVGLLGVYGSYVGWDYHSTRTATSPVGGIIDVTGADVGRLGIEAQLYLDNFSLEGRAGYQAGSKQGTFGKATLAFYPTENLRFDVSYSDGEISNSTVSGGIEWMAAPDSGMSLFAIGTIDSDDQRVYAGLKFYLGGEPKSLVRRHREDDPDNDLPFDLFTIVGNAYCPAGTHDVGGSCDGNL